MESPEGKGNARRAWEAYVRATNRVAGPVLRPAVEPVAKYLAMNMTTDLFGFWLIWLLLWRARCCRANQASGSASEA